MKTRLLHFYQSMLFIVITGSIMATPHTLPVRAIVLPANNGAITYDGLADETGYSASQSTTAFNVTGSTGADADFTATFKVCFNAERLFICFTILDDYACEIPFTTSPDPWSWDCVEVFLSLDTTGTTPEYDSNTIQLLFNRGIVDSATTPGRADQSEYADNVYYENTADGWVLEVGIPWTSVLSEGQDPEDIITYFGDVVNGFDVSCVDNDTDGPDAIACMTAWDDDDPVMPDATEDLAWCNRTMFGVMTLGLHNDVWGPYSLEQTDQNRLEIYPNPVRDQLYLKNIGEVTSNYIINILGEKVLEIDNINTNSIDVSMLKQGLYTIIIDNKEVAQFLKE